MNHKFYILFTASFLFLASCNKKQETKTEEESLIENTAADSIAEGSEEQTPRKESINLFNLTPKDSSNVAFVSLSDIYGPADEKDTLTLPPIETMDIISAAYFTFEKPYRKRFFTRTNISENDSVFIYDYAKNKSVSLAVKNLKTAAMINGYSSTEDWPYQHFDYMIGFEINKKYLDGFSEYYQDALVYVGPENPFAKERLTPILWKKTTSKEFPAKELSGEHKKMLKNTLTGTTHSFKTNSYNYFLQDYLDSHKIIYARRLLVTNSKTNEIVIEKLYSQSEGTSPSPLNFEEGDHVVNQWTGKLFKNKPPVVFGFEYVSFGCPGISIIDKSNEEIYLQCDNRH